MNNTNEVTQIPDSIAVCPKCGALLIVEDITEWYEDGTIPETGISFNCSTEPSIDTDEWEEWFNSHWSTPYIDWLPLQSKLTRWYNEAQRGRQ